MQVKPIVTVVLLFHYAGFDFSATFPAADLFSTCCRCSLHVYILCLATFWKVVHRRPIGMSIRRKIEAGNWWKELYWIPSGIRCLDLSEYRPVTDLLGGLEGKCAYVIPCSLILTVLKAIHMHFT